MKSNSYSRPSLRTIAIYIILSGSWVLAREHPFLLFHSQDLPALQQKVKTVEWSGKAYKEMQERLARAGKPELPPVNAKIRSEWSRAINRHGRTAQDAAFLYLMTGDSTYFNRAREVLLVFARNFDRLDVHNLEDKDGIWVYQTGGFGIKCALAYDMIYNALTTAERQEIETGLLRNIVRMVKRSAEEQDVFSAWANSGTVDTTRARDYNWGPGQWNGVLYCNAGLTAISFVLEDRELIEQRIGNWKTYLARDMLCDGFWQDEDFHYSRFCYSSMLVVAEMARQYGYPEDLYTIRVPARPAAQWDTHYGVAFDPEGTGCDDRTLRMYLDAQIDYQYPDLSAGNWGWQYNSARLIGQGTDVTFYELGYLRYREPAYGWLLNKMDRSQGNWYAWGSLSPILYGQPLDSVATPATASIWYQHNQWIVLKSVEGPGYWGSDALYAFMPYGLERNKPIARLSVDLFAFGKVVAPRVSKQSRLQSHDRSYYINDDSWNNVQVDGENLVMMKGDIVNSALRFHDFNPDIKIAGARLDRERKVRHSIWYPDQVVERRPDLDYTMSRTLGLTDYYLLDITAVAFQQAPSYKHTFEWIWHAAGQLTLEGAKEGEDVQGSWSAVWRDSDSIGLKTTMLGLAGPELGSSIVRVRSNPINTYVKVMRSNFNEQYLAVHEPFKGSPALDSVICLYQDSARVVVKLVKKDGTTDYLGVAFAADRAEAERDGEQVTIEGHYGFIRKTPGKITARGDLAAFTLKAEKQTVVDVNGKIVKARFKKGMLHYQR